VIELREARAGKLLASLRGHAAAVTSLSFSPDGKLLASGSANTFLEQRGDLKVWDVASGQERLGLAEAARACLGVAFSGDGRELAAAWTDGAVEVWGGAGEELAVLRGNSRRSGFENFWCVAFSRDGKTIAAGGPSSGASTWDAATGRLREALRDRDTGVRSLAFSRDGRSLFLAGNADKVSEWDLIADRERRTFGKTSDWLQGIALSPDGGTIASVGWT
jgi:WD40 repeat protein